MFWRRKKNITGVNKKQNQYKNKSIENIQFIRNPLINSKGEDTSATFGFVNSLLKIVRDEKPDYVAVVFDTKHPAALVL